MRLLFLVLLALPVVARAGALVLDAPCGVLLPDGGSVTAPGHAVVTTSTMAARS